MQDTESPNKKAFQEMVICVKCWEQSNESTTTTLTDLAQKKILGSLQGEAEKQDLLQWPEERVHDRKVETVITGNFSQSFRVTGIGPTISSRMTAGPKGFVFCPILF